MFQTFDCPPPSTTTAPRVAALRALLATQNLDALFVPRTDEHQNEYVPACCERLAFLTGFTGSAGLAVVAAKAAALFVDGRYTVQAPKEVDTALFTIKGIRTTDLKPWLLETLVPHHRKAMLRIDGAKADHRVAVGFDPKLHTIAEIEALREQLAGSPLILKPVSRNLVDRVWGGERPPAPTGPIIVQPLEFTGRSAADKIAAVQKTLKDAKQDAVVLTAPDSICWLFNIRGSDVAHNPVVMAYAIVPASGKADLFVDPRKLTTQAKEHLAPVAKLRGMDAFKAALIALKAANKAVRLSAGASWWCCQTLGGVKRIKRAGDPCVEPKAVKTAAEIAGARAAHLRDGAAVTRFLAWLDGAVARGGLDEITAVRQLEQFRHETRMEGDPKDGTSPKVGTSPKDGTSALKELSFPTISGSGPHGAIVHYRVTTATNRTLQPGELFLVDSGGQYTDGTTDITRTVAIGTPSDEMAERFTLVLKGMIAVSRARFPRGTRGVDIDPLARRALWDAGLNYDHGTGHGVGSYLNVHEGPQSISKAGMAELKPGMICSNEPGYYKVGQYGIRIENLVLVTEPHDVGGDFPVLGFETLTLAPIDRRLIVCALLSGDEVAWLDAYHARVAAAVGPLVDASTRRWLKVATAGLG